MGLQVEEGRANGPRRRRVQETAAQGASSLVSEAVRKVRTEIMTGRLRPGQKLVEAELVAALGISRASVREVLRALQGERLIELVPNRGPSVAGLGSRQVDDIEQVWTLLTSDALSRFASTRKAEDVAALRERLQRIRQTLGAGRNVEAIDAINAFFWYIIQRCGNAVLLDVVVLLVSRLNFLRAQSMRDARWRKLCGKEIGAILAAVEAGDPEAARASTAVHIGSTCQAARGAASVVESEEGRPVEEAPVRSLPLIPLDEYLDRGLAPRRRAPGRRGKP